MAANRMVISVEILDLAEAKELFAEAEAAVNAANGVTAAAKEVLTVLRCFVRSINETEKPYPVTVKRILDRFEKKIVAAGIEPGYSARLEDAVALAEMAAFPELDT